MTIKTSQEVFAEFRADFQALLAKYNAELEVEESESYGSYTKESLFLFIPSKYDSETDEYVTECVNVDLGRSFSKDSI